MGRTCGTHGGVGNAYKFWSENLKGRDHSEDPRCRWNDNIRMNVREVGWESVFMWLRIGTIGVCCEHGNEPFGSIKIGEFLDYLSDYKLKKDSAPCS
jgi:hypothetical protein